MYGMLFSFKKFVSKINPKSVDGPAQFQSYATSSYKLHCFESLTGLKFILTTDLAESSDQVRRDLRELYRAVYVECVARDPVYTPGDKIDSPLFIESTKKHIEGLSYFV